jgi:hypothetical protein
MSDPAISTTGLTRDFGAVRALDGLSLDVPSGVRDRLAGSCGTHVRSGPDGRCAIDPEREIGAYGSNGARRRSRHAETGDFTRGKWSRYSDSNRGPAVFESRRPTRFAPIRAPQRGSSAPTRPCLAELGARVYSPSHATALSRSCGSLTQGSAQGLPPGSLTVLSFRQAIDHAACTTSAATTWSRQTATQTRYISLSKDATMRAKAISSPAAADATDSERSPPAVPVVASMPVGPLQ